MDTKTAIVFCQWKNRKQSGFAFFNQDSMICKMTGFDAADFFQTEQTVNRKKSGFRAARSRP